MKHYLSTFLVAALATSPALAQFARDGNTTHPTRSALLGTLLPVGAFSITQDHYTYETFKALMDASVADYKRRCSAYEYLAWETRANTAQVVRDAFMTSAKLNGWEAKKQADKGITQDYTFTKGKVTVFARVTIPRYAREVYEIQLCHIK